jgi:hypothetical protein
MITFIYHLHIPLHYFTIYTESFPSSAWCHQSPGEGATGTAFCSFQYEDGSTSLPYLESHAHPASPSANKMASAGFQAGYVHRFFGRPLSKDSALSNWHGLAVTKWSKPSCYNLKYLRLVITYLGLYPSCYNLKYLRYTLDHLPLDTAVWKGKWSEHVMAGNNFSVLCGNLGRTETHSLGHIPLYQYDIPWYTWCHCHLFDSFFSGVNPPKGYWLWLNTCSQLG